MADISQFVTIARYTARDKLFRPQIVKRLASSQNQGGVTYAHKTLETSREVNRRIADMIDSGKPFCVGRFGCWNVWCGKDF